MRRFVRTLAFAGALLAGSATPSPVSASIPKAITWTLDHTAKTITVRVRLFLYPACKTLGAPGPTCWMAPGIPKRIRDDILKVWNRGYKYRCYTLIFDVDIVSNDDANRFTVPDDRVGVQIEREALAFRSYVHGVRSVTGSWDSNDPDHKVVPTNSAWLPTRWGYPPSNKETTYAHEYGHLLGLDDAYSWWTDEPKSGAPVDLMSKGGVTTIDQSTIDRLVKRSGVIKDSDLQCGYRVNYNEGPMHITGLKCGGFEGRWELEEHMDFAMTQHFKLVADIGHDMRGTYTFLFDVSNLRQGGRVGPGGTAGASGGEAVFEPGPPATLSLTGTKPFKFVLETNVPECAGK